MPSWLDDAGDAVRNVIRAYHGSPYDFDKFNAAKIGKGEGAQVYGHGLYFAGNEAVANQYRKQLAGEPLPMDLAIDGSPVFRRDWQNLPPLHKDGTNYLMSRLRNYSDDYASEALSEIQKDLPGLLDNAKSAPPVGVDGDQWYRERYTRERRIRELQGAMELLRDRKVTVLPSQRPGHTYEVELGHPEESLLDWDAPLGKQPPAVAEMLKNRLGGGYFSMIGEPGDGRRMWHHFVDSYGPPKAAQRMVDAGIPGVRYLDQGSRSAGEGTRNYVMFPGTEDSIRILRKYGLMAPVAAGAAASSANEQPAP